MKGLTHEMGQEEVAGLDNAPLRIFSLTHEMETYEVGVSSLRPICSYFS